MATVLAKQCWRVCACAAGFSPVLSSAWDTSKFVLGKFVFGVDPGHVLDLSEVPSLLAISLFVFSLCSVYVYV